MFITTTVHKTYSLTTTNRPFPALRRGPIFLFAAFLVLAAPSVALAAIRAVTANPGENSSTQINIGWHADLTQTSCSVIYTEKADTNWTRAKTVAGQSEHSDVFDGISSKKPNNEDWNEEAIFLNYGASLTGLTPDTDYMYKITCASDSAETSVTAPRYFKTAGASEFTFLWFGDSHGYTPIPSRINNMNRIIQAGIDIEPSVDFIFSTGDVVAWGGSYSFWTNLFDQPFAANYMFADVIGNHDWMIRGSGGSSEFFRVAHNNPTNGYHGQEGVCYWFIYGDVLFITLNNELMKTSPAAEATAKEWAASVIKAQEGNYQRIFLAQHYQWFDGRNGRTSWYKNWKDFCDQHNVTLAMAGNNHIYKRTHTLRNDQVVPDGLGTVYMEIPSSDGERGVKAGPLTMNADKIARTYSSQVHSSETSVKTIGCVLVDVRPDNIRTRLVYIDDDGQVHVDDEHTFKTRSADASRPDIQNTNTTAPATGE